MRTTGRCTCAGHCVFNVWRCIARVMIAVRIGCDDDTLGRRCCYLCNNTISTVNVIVMFVWIDLFFVLFFIWFDSKLDAIVLRIDANMSTKTYIKKKTLKKNKSHVKWVVEKEKEMMNRNVMPTEWIDRAQSWWTFIKNLFFVFVLMCVQIRISNHRWKSHIYE